MSDIAIRVEHLGKQYRLGGPRAPYATFRETLVNTARAPLRWLKGERPAPSETLWALDDVSFEIKRGEAVGIIGRNGAGKSTLLKILSHITAPTRGRVDLYGRVGSLLEVGTGFHPELTGRENIYLNGAILGMTRAEIARKFDEIVAFAEVERFLDTPVKHYSSGMYVRLAFSVAAHLDPEILLVDEVLAVGDAEFQKKCLGKMGDVTHEGRTVLFVSHNMGAVQRLCPQTILIDNGRLNIFGVSVNVIDEYLHASTHLDQINSFDLSNWPNRYGEGSVKIINARTLDKNNCYSNIFHRNELISIEYEFINNYSKAEFFSIVIMTANGEKILHLSHFDTPGTHAQFLSKGKYKGKFIIPNLPLCAGIYRVAIGIHTESTFPLDVVLDVLPFSVEDMIESPRPFRTSNDLAFCSTPSQFSLVKMD